MEEDAIEAAKRIEAEQPKCALCGESMPPGEEMFKYHGFSGPCPKPHQPPVLSNPLEQVACPFSRGRLLELWKEHGGAVDKKGRAWIEHDLLAAMLCSIIERAAPLILKDHRALLRRPERDDVIEACAKVVEGMRPCPFDKGDPGLAPDDPCPVCGDLGTLAAINEPSKCQNPAAIIRALKSPPPPPGK